MTPLKHLFIASVLLFPALATAETQTFRCHAPHFVRFLSTNNVTEPPELRLTVLSFNNADPQHEAVIERLTVRDSFGVVRHDSGPGIGIAHPLNLGVQNITTVPRGGTFAFATTDLWGSNVPPFALQTPPLTLVQQFVLLGGLSMTVEVSKPGNPHLFVVHASERMRVPPLGGGPIAAGAERSSKTARCFRISGRNDG